MKMYLILQKGLRVSSFINHRSEYMLKFVLWY